MRHVSFFQSSLEKIWPHWASSTAHYTLTAQTELADYTNFYKRHCCSSRHDIPQASDTSSTVIHRRQATPLSKAQLWCLTVHLVTRLSLTLTCAHGRYFITVAVAVVAGVTCGDVVYDLDIRCRGAGVKSAAVVFIHIACCWALICCTHTQTHRPYANHKQFFTVFSLCSILCFPSWWCQHSVLPYHDIIFGDLGKMLRSLTSANLSVKWL